MSVEAITWALEQRDMTTGEKLLLVVIANSADEAGAGYPGHDLLAARCCSSLATVSRNIKRLEDAQLLARIERRRRNGSRTSDWIVLGPLAADRAPMKDAIADNYPPAIAEVARSTSLFQLESSPLKTLGDDLSADISSGLHLAESGGPEPSEEPSGKDPLPPSRIVRYNRRRVPAGDLALAEQILARFNDLANTTYRAYTRTGRPSEGLQRIIGALFELDGLTLEIAERMISQALTDPFWAPAPAQPGNVFGGKVRDRNFQAACKRAASRSGADAFIDRHDARRAAA